MPCISAGLDGSCGHCGASGLALAVLAGDPDSFSRVDLSRPAAALRKEFPLFPVREWEVACLVCSSKS